MELKKSQLVTQSKNGWLINMYNNFQLKLLGLTTLIISKLIKYKNAQLFLSLIFENYSIIIILWFALTGKKKNSYYIFDSKCLLTRNNSYKFRY